MYLQKITNEASSNPKRFWSYYSFRNKRNPIPDKVDYRGTSITDDLARAEAMARNSERACAIDAET